MVLDVGLAGNTVLRHRTTVLAGRITEVEDATEVHEERIVHRVLQKIVLSCARGADDRTGHQRSVAHARSDPRRPSMLRVTDIRWRNDHRWLIDHLEWSRRPSVLRSTM
jgi:hypothetical protein